MIFDYTIIGAGVAGLSIAALLAKDGYTVQLIESHSKPGGCASFFRDKGFRYDVGATTLSGFREGEPIHKLVKLLDLDKISFKNKSLNGELEANLNISPSKNGIQIYQAAKSIRRYSDKRAWIEESYEKLIEKKSAEAKLRHQQFWEELYKIEKDGFYILSKHKNLIPASFNDLIKCLNPEKLFASITALKHLPELFLPLDYLLKKYFLQDEMKFIEFLDEQLIISTQNNTKKTPIFTAALGLTYASSINYVYGGVNQLAVALLSKCEELGVKVTMRREVVKIEKLTDRTNTVGSYKLVDKSNEEYFTKNIISNLSFWNMAEMTNGSIRDFYEIFAARFQYSISAFTVYLGLETDYKPTTDYAQIILDSPIKHCCSKSFFVSYSRSNDKIKAEDKGLNIIISTHTDSAEWLDLDPEIYLQKKTETETEILKELFKHIPELISSDSKLNETKIKSLISGTAKTFQHYTKRKNGTVGGLPHSIDYSFFELMPKKVPGEKIFMVGDTGFPGQGLVSTVYSALSVYEAVK